MVEQPVTWFVSGGSCIQLAVEAGRLPHEPSGRLAVMLVDERYGSPKHPDSNWEQLRKAGFSLPGARLVPILDGQTRVQTARTFAAFVREALDTSYCIGLFGMGADGHTAGILPGSIAADSTKLVAGYTAADFERITITPAAIAQFDEAILYAVGPSKQTMLQNLADDLQLNRQPAQVLKQVPTVTIFNDYIGETL